MCFIWVSDNIVFLELIIFVYCTDAKTLFCEYVYSIKGFWLSTHGIYMNIVVPSFSQKIKLHA